jgi:hypothetical protein
MKGHLPAQASFFLAALAAVAAAAVAAAVAVAVAVAALGGRGKVQGIFRPHRPIQFRLQWVKDQIHFVQQQRASPKDV